MTIDQEIEYMNELIKQIRYKSLEVNGKTNDSYTKDVSDSIRSIALTMQQSIDRIKTIVKEYQIGMADDWR
jgi:hypothetical protein